MLFRYIIKRKRFGFLLWTHFASSSWSFFSCFLVRSARHDCYIQLISIALKRIRKEIIALHNLFRHCFLHLGDQFASVGNGWIRPRIFVALEFALFLNQLVFVFNHFTSKRVGWLVRMKLSFFTFLFNCDCFDIISQLIPSWISFVLFDLLGCKLHTFFVQKPFIVAPSSRLLSYCRAHSTAISIWFSSYCVIVLITLAVFVITSLLRKTI